MMVVSCFMIIFWYFQDLILKIFIIFVKTNFGFSFILVNRLIKYFNQTIQFYYFYYSRAVKLIISLVTFLYSNHQVISSFR
jgi:hypothetical protein